MCTQMETGNTFKDVKTVHVTKMEPRQPKFKSVEDELNYLRSQNSRLIQKCSNYKRTIKQYSKSLLAEKMLNQKMVARFASLAEFRAEKV